MNNTRGPVCGSELGGAWIDAGTLSRTQVSTRTPAGAGTASQAERELLLDVTQMILDLSGILDPTPVSDGSNVVISLARGDWAGAGISSVSLLPYVGDLAKAGKLGKWARTVHQCVDLARRNARFAQRVKPLLKQLARLLDELPTRLVPDAARVQLTQMKEALASVAGISTRLSRRTVLDAYRKEWHAYIARIQFRPQAPGTGVLWSRLPGSDVEAQSLAMLDDKQTLEMMLSDFDIPKKYALAKAQLDELLGNTEAIQAEIWTQFGRPIWEQLSKKYAMTLRGEVKAYVRFTPTRFSGAGSHAAGHTLPVRGYTPPEVVQGITKDPDKLKKVFDKDPLIFAELDVISDTMLLNPAITSVRLVDSSSGVVAFMTREEVLRSYQRTN